MVKQTQTISRVCLTILWGCRLKGYGETVNLVDKNMAELIVIFFWQISIQSHQKYPRQPPGNLFSWLYCSL